MYENVYQICMHKVLFNGLEKGSIYIILKLNKY